MPSDSLLHPADEEEVRHYIVLAGKEGRKIRVRGSGHSVRDAIYADSEGAEARGYNLYLDRLNKVHLDDATKRVTAEAGCHLGHDPSDPARTATIESSLFHQLDRHGWAFP